MPPKARDIAMVFQNYALYPHMTVYENMAFALKLRKTPKAEIDRRVKEAARLLDMDEALLSRKPKALSGGQRQRVAMGRAIVREPQVFLMDEPLSNLDAKLRVQTRAQIAALQQRLGVTTVYVTHDQVEAMTMGDRVAVLLDGMLQQVDAPRALYDRPANAFVAGFIGSPAMNIRTVPLTDSGADFGGMILPLTREQVAAARADGGGDTVTVGFRPEHTELVGRDRRRHADRGRAGRGARLGRLRARPRRASTAAHETLRRPHRRPDHPRAWARPSSSGRGSAPTTRSTPSPASASAEPTEHSDKGGPGDRAALAVPVHRALLGLVRLTAWLHPYPRVVSRTATDAAA